MKKLLFIAVLLQPILVFAITQKQNCEIQLGSDETLDDAGQKAGLFCPKTLHVSYEKVPVEVNTKVTLAGETDGTFFREVTYTVYEEFMKGYNKFHACTGRWGDYLWYQEYQGSGARIFISDTEVGALLTHDHCTYSCVEAK